MYIKICIFCVNELKMSIIANFVEIYNKRKKSQNLRCTIRNLFLFSVTYLLYFDLNYYKC